jgi:hypothetical protein
LGEGGSSRNGKARSRFLKSSASVAETYWKATNMFTVRSKVPLVFTLAMICTADSQIVSLPTYGPSVTAMSLRKKSAIEVFQTCVQAKRLHRYRNCTLFSNGKGEIQRPTSRPKKYSAFQDKVTTSTNHFPPRDLCKTGSATNWTGFECERESKTRNLSAHDINFSIKHSQVNILLR